jgi:hypothetical protein
VTHKGVVRAALSLATGWDMIAKPPLRLAGDTALVLHAAAGIDVGADRRITPLPMLPL